MVEGVGAAVEIEALVAIGQRPVGDVHQTRRGHHTPYAVEEPDVREIFRQTLLGHGEERNLACPVRICRSLIDGDGNVLIVNASRIQGRLTEGSKR